MISHGEKRWKPLSRYGVREKDILVKQQKHNFESLRCAIKFGIRCNGLFEMKFPYAHLLVYDR